MTYKYNVNDKKKKKLLISQRKEKKIIVRTKPYKNALSRTIYSEKPNWNRLVLGPRSVSYCKEAAIRHSGINSLLTRYKISKHKMRLKSIAAQFYSSNEQTRVIPRERLFTRVERPYSGDGKLAC